MLIETGIPTPEDIQSVTPSEERFRKGPVAIAECFQKIPWNPCTKACVKQAIRVEPDINETPKIDYDVCNGCGACIARCPGLAIFVVDKTYGENEALVSFRLNFSPFPKPDRKPAAWIVREKNWDGSELKKSSRAERKT